MKPVADRRQPSILFLYMVAHTGHQKASEAIMDAVTRMNPRVRSVGVDAANQSYPLIGPMFNEMYLQMLKRAPAIWDFLYDNPDIEFATRDARQLLALISSFKMKRIIDQHRPLAVVCTQAAPALVVASQKRRGRIKIPLVGVITDFGVHSYWIQNEIDLYLVPHEGIRDTLIKKGVAASKIRITGIPIHPNFGETRDAAKERRRLHLHPTKPVILVMGGGHGLGELDKIVDTLKTLPYDVQVLVVCGRNKTVQREIQERTSGYPNFTAVGYTKDLAGLMTAADLLVTKPGGLTCTEALAKQLPMILTNPIPGQEERNVRYLTEQKVARLARTPEDLLHTVGDLIRHPKKAAEIRQRMRMLSTPHSAWEAARLIFDLINHRSGFRGNAV